MTDDARVPTSATGGGVGTVAVGSLLGEEGRYRLDRLTGTGGMASVWTAHDARLDRTVAVKVISDTLALDPTFLERFAREARLAGGLSHPHVVQVYDYGTHGTRPYLVMEHVTGGTLADRLKRGQGGWDPAVLARELLDALGYIHAQGILHRDLKPANVLIGADGRARLTDFGIAQLADSTRLTSTGVMGTAQYTAPEVMAGAPPSRSSDLFSCGVLLRECGGVAPTLRALVDALTQRDPEQRPPDAHAALALLSSDRLDAPTVALPATAPVLPPTKVLTSAMPSSSRPDATPPGAPSAGTSLEGLVRDRRTRVISGVAAVGAVMTVAILLAGRGGSVEPLELPSRTGTLAEQLSELDAAIDDARR